MFSGAHVVLYSSDPEADRVFLRDVLGFRGVDAGEGWLIFKLPPAEAAVHPTEGQPKQELYLMCPNLEMALADLASQGRHDLAPGEGHELGGVGQLSSFRAVLICRSTSHVIPRPTTWRTSLSQA